MLFDLTAKKARVEQKMKELVDLWNAQLPMAMTTPKAAGRPFTANVGYGNKVFMPNNYKDFYSLLGQIESQKLGHISSAKHGTGNFLSKGSIASLVGRHNALVGECKILLMEIEEMEKALEIAGTLLAMQGLRSTTLKNMPVHIHEQILIALNKGNTKNLIALILMGGIKHFTNVEDRAFIERILFGVGKGDLTKSSTKAANKAVESIIKKLKKSDGATFDSVAAVDAFIAKQKTRITINTTQDGKIKANIDGSTITENFTQNLLNITTNIKQRGLWQKFLNRFK